MATKILLATPLYPPEIGGPATYSALLEKELPKKGADLKLVAFRDSRQLPKVIRHIHYFVELLKAMGDCQVVFAQDTVSVGLPAMLAAKVRRRKFMLRVPGDYAWEQSVQRYAVKDSIDDFQNKKYGWRVEFLRFLQIMVAKGADVVITPSDYFNRLVSGWGVQAEKVKTIYNGLDLNIEAIQVENAKPKTMITAGRLVPWKGIAGLIKLLTQLPDWNLEIVGDGPDRKRLEEIAKEVGVSDRVKFHGSISRTEVFARIQAADVFVLNTEFESFSFQVVEAMYSGTPVVTTNVGSLPELIEHGVHGLLVNPGDSQAIKEAVLSTKSEPGIWQTRTESAKEKAKLFSIDNTVSAVAKTVAEINHE